MCKVLITGASRGIGKSIKMLFESRGKKVFAPNRTELNLISNNSILDYVSQIGDIDSLINCAGINDLASIDELDENKFLEMLQVNLIAQTFLIKAVSTSMKKKNYGRIVNFSSIWSDFSKERRIMYSIAKAGVNGLTKASTVELAKYNIMVNAIAPGFVNTEMTSKNNSLEQIKIITDALPIRRMAEPEEIAEVVFFLASKENSFMTGQTIFVDGGFSCV